MTQTTTTEASLSEVMNWMQDQTWSDFAQSLADQFAARGRLSEKQEAAARKMYAKGQARQTTKAAPMVDPPVGLHVTADGEIIRVLTTRNSGQLVAKALVADGGDWQWDYRGKRGLFGLSPATLMSAEQARLWGSQYMSCVNCFADLEDRRSLAAGYGPTCAKNNGWHYPSSAEAEAILAERGA